MAQFTINMALSAGGTLNGGNPLTDANAQRIIAAHRTIYGMDPASTAQQVWAQIAARVFAHLKQTTMNHEIVVQQEQITAPDIT